MGDRLKVRGSNDPVDMFLIEAMIAEDEKQLDKFLPDLAKGDREVEVVLTINGKEAPLVSVLRGFFDRMESSMGEEILTKAKALVSEAGLDQVREALYRAEYDIQAALEQALTTQHPEGGDER